MSDHKEIMKDLSDKMVDIQNSFISKISHQVIENLKSIKLLDDRVAKLEKENIDLKIEVSKEFGGTTDE